MREEDAEDVSQEVFAAAARRLPDFRRNRPGGTFRGWLRGVARNVLLAHHRKARDEPGGVGGSTAQMRLGEVAALTRRALEAVRAEFEAGTWAAFLRAVVRPAKSRVLRRVRQELGELGG